MASTEVVDVELLHGMLRCPLHTMPRDGHVAYSVWPCSVFLINCLAGWRVKEVASGGGVDRCLGVDNAHDLIASWMGLEPPAQRFILERTRWRELLQSVRVLDLGSGTGVVGLGLHALGARRVVLTDMPKCMTLAERNVAEWIAAHPQLAPEVLVAKPLSWEHYQPGDADRSLGNDGDTQSQLDVMVACDCIYGTMHIGRSPMVPIIADFLLGDADLGKDNVGHGTHGGLCKEKMVLVAYESRDDDIESSFWYQVGQVPNIRYTLLAQSCADPSEGNEKLTTSYSLFAVTKCDGGSNDSCAVVTAGGSSEGGQ